MDKNNELKEAPEILERGLFGIMHEQHAAAILAHIVAYGDGRGHYLADDLLEKIEMNY